MATGSILLGMALLVLTGLFIARPFMRPREEEGDLTEYQLLQEEKEVLLDQIQALDFDFDTGKIPKDVHQLQRARLMEEATAVLKSIDQAGGDGDTAVPDAVDLDIEIEAAIARIRQQRRHKEFAPTPAAGLATNGHARFCPQCGTPTDPDDRFCANCGHKLSLESSTKTA